MGPSNKSLKPFKKRTEISLEPQNQCNFNKTEHNAKIKKY